MTVSLASAIAVKSGWGQAWIVVQDDAPPDRLACGSVARQVFPPRLGLGAAAEDATHHRGCAFVVVQEAEGAAPRREGFRFRVVRRREEAVESKGRPGSRRASSHEV